VANGGARRKMLADERRFADVGAVLGHDASVETSATERGHAGREEVERGSFQSCFSHVLSRLGFSVGPLFGLLDLGWWERPGGRSREWFLVGFRSR
jgi:hypothetical protein